MFVIGGCKATNCEVFDSFSKKFTKINSEFKVLYSELWYYNAFSISNSIVVFQDFPESFSETIVYLYDVDKEKWLKY